MKDKSQLSFFFLLVNVFIFGCAWASFAHAPVPRCVNLSICSTQAQQLQLTGLVHVARQLWHMDLVVLVRVGSFQTMIKPVSPA